MEIAVIGFGRIAELLYAPHLRTLAADRLVVAEPNPERRAAAGRLLPGSEPVASIGDMPAPRADRAVALNLLPGPTHADVTEQLLRAGWHVFSEKPPAADQQRWLELAAVADNTGRALAAAPVWPYDLAVEAVREQLAAGAIGTLAEVHGRYLAAGPARRGYIDADRQWFFGPDSCVVRDLAPYVLAVLVRLLGAPDHLHWTRNGIREPVPVRPSGSITPVHPGAAVGVGAWGDALGLIQVAYRPADPEVRADIELVGTKGTLRLPADPQGDHGPALQKAVHALDLVDRAAADPLFQTEHIKLVSHWLSLVHPPLR